MTPKKHLQPIYDPHSVHLLNTHNSLTNKMDTIILKIVYINNDLKHVSANHYAIYTPPTILSRNMQQATVYALCWCYYYISWPTFLWFWNLLSALTAQKMSLHISVSDVPLFFRSLTILREAVPLVQCHMFESKLIFCRDHFIISINMSQPPSLFLLQIQAKHQVP